MTVTVGTVWAMCGQAGPDRPSGCTVHRHAVTAHLPGSSLVCPRQGMRSATRPPVEVALTRPITQPSGQPDAASQPGRKHDGRDAPQIVCASLSARLRAALICITRRGTGARSVSPISGTLSLTQPRQGDATGHRATPPISPMCMSARTGSARTLAPRTSSAPCFGSTATSTTCNGGSSDLDERQLRRHSTGGVPWYMRTTKPEMTNRKATR